MCDDNTVYAHIAIYTCISVYFVYTVCLYIYICIILLPYRVPASTAVLYASNALSGVAIGVLAMTSHVVILLLRRGTELPLLVLLPPIRLNPSPLAVTSQYVYALLNVYTLYYTIYGAKLIIYIYNT